ncbi:MAG: hypothetical protein M1376_18020 [Planctomycetes bacterium]|nr:hypothetical protein [Planctomycetota bacterium]
MDRKVRALGYRRDPGETLHAFAERIDQTGPEAGCVSRAGSSCFADWYLRYAGLRYAPDLDPGRIEQLQRLAQEPHDFVAPASRP